MKRVLFVITERNSANGICVKSVMEELMNNGYKVFCVTNREYRDNVYFYQNGVEFIQLDQGFRTEFLLI